ncbi:DUF4148 domain-containing protein [Paraburkholderia haematera]|uniref:DUF4148 domain-containing protein n=1 Tax=Paraburkholderia haematera TaxID=2793077 RepID=A0ABM8SW82_9BURK|nr:DUF4148 domain-containing protein [Paraburkholderia haematera]CAE6835380.1 hypothetical protein R69888_06744 [Paraburkholderia haematera]
MKSKRIALAVIFMSVLSTSVLADNDQSVSALAASQSSQYVPAAQSRPIGKTRAQVRQELIDARREGTIPTTEADYPPSQRTIDANRARHQILERYWASTD